MDFYTLRRAARILAPASLQLTSPQPRCLSFITDARKHRGEITVTLSPIGGATRRGDAAVLDFLLEGQAWTARGRVVEHVERTATLLVRRELELRPPRRGRVVPPAGALVAVFVPEGTGLGRCCQPVLDIGGRALRLTSSYPFEAGLRLRDLVVLRGHQVVRRAEGTVLHSAPVIEVDGTTAHHCAVRLRRLTTVPSLDDPADVVEITEPARVRTILWGLSDLASPVTLRSGTDAVAGQLLAVRGSREALPAMRCLMERELQLTGTVQVECALYGSGYRFHARIGRGEGGTLHLVPAPVVREWHRRAEERLTMPAGAGGTVSFRHPLDGRAHERRLNDVSVQGFGFAPQPDDEALWPGLPLEDVRLRLSTHAVRPTGVIVRTVGKHRCGVQMAHPRDREADHLRFELMKQSAHPIEFDDGDALDSILAFHKSARLLESDMARNLEHTLAETRRGWRVAHRHPDGLMRTAFVRWKGSVGATATLVRAYDRSWTIQHVAVASPAVPTTVGSLHSTLVRLASVRSDCDHVFGFIVDNARSVHAMLDGLLSEWSTPEHRGATQLELYAGDTRPPARRATGARRLGRAHEQLIENAALRLLAPACARALGLRVGQIGLHASAAAWRRVGLQRGREAWGVSKGGRPVAILLREWASPGLSLSSVLNAALYLPVQPDPSGEAARALVGVALERPLPGAPLVRFVFVPTGCDPGPLHAAGLRRVAGCTLYAFGGLGLREYHRYMASRYGFFYGRLRARVAAAP